jgi:hypothetical protein
VNIRSSILANRYGILASNTCKRIFKEELEEEARMSSEDIEKEKGVSAW